MLVGPLDDAIAARMITVIASSLVPDESPVTDRRVRPS
jgi:hypothetical protein